MCRLLAVEIGQGYPHQYIHPVPCKRVVGKLFVLGVGILMDDVLGVGNSFGGLFLININNFPLS